MQKVCPHLDNVTGQILILLEVIMAMIRYHQPSSVLRELQQELFPLLSAWSDAQSQTQPLEGLGWIPKVDIKEEDKEFVVYADIPGVNPNEIEIEMEGNSLIIKGERKSEKEEKGKGYYRSECTTGKFYRQFTLPESVDSAKIHAVSKHGVLTIHLPKAEEGKHQRKIKVQEHKD